MKQKTINTIRKIQKLTQEKCKGCGSPGEYRCCSMYLCGLAELTMRNLGGSIPKTNHPSLPYMGPNGCVLPAEYRPVCSGFVCKPHLDENRTFRREYNRLHDRMTSDPEVAMAVNQASNELPPDVFEAAIQKLETHDEP